jgi:hypothetical protein
MQRMLNKVVGKNGPRRARSPEPTFSPWRAPSPDPTSAPTAAPSAPPTVVPLLPPTAFPTLGPTVVAAAASEGPRTSAPTFAPTARPSVSPTLGPPPDSTLVPTTVLSVAALLPPTLSLSDSPTLLSRPDADPSRATTIYLSVSGVPGDYTATKLTSLKAEIAAVAGVAPGRAAVLDGAVARARRAPAHVARVHTHACACAPVHALGRTRMLGGSSRGALYSWPCCHNYIGHNYIIYKIK